MEPSVHSSSDVDFKPVDPVFERDLLQRDHALDVEKKKTNKKLGIGALVACMAPLNHALHPC